MEASGGVVSGEAGSLHEKNQVEIIGTQNSN